MGGSLRGKDDKGGRETRPSAGRASIRKKGYLRTKERRGSGFPRGLSEKGVLRESVNRQM